MGIIEAQENIQELNKWIDYFTNLHSQLLMEKNLKMSITQNQKNKEVEIDWALIEKYLVDLNLNGRTGADQQP
nr:LOC545732 protein [Mus musculus]